jgi:hypothetical protein
VTESDYWGSLLEVVDKRVPWPHLDERIKYGRTGRVFASCKALIEECIRRRFGVSEAAI